jgi:nucleotide-binding universal stress UspA family protein
MKFLVGYNGSDVAKSALAVARTYAKRFDAEVAVMTSMGGGDRETIEDIGKVEQDLLYAKKYMEAEEIVCETHQVARGASPGEDMVFFVEENNIDQLFVGVEKKSKTRKMFMGSTAQYVILKAPCPVTAVK